MSRPDQLPPHDQDAERCLAGSLILLNNDDAEWMQAQSLVSPAAFYDIACASMARAMWRMRERGVAIDAVTLRDELRSAGELRVPDREEADVGSEDIARCLDAVPSAANWKHYAEIVAEKYKLRQILTVAVRAVRRCYEPQQTPVADEIARGTTESLTALLGAQARSNYVHVGQAIDDAMRDMVGQGVPQIPTGFADLDFVYGGLGMGEVVVVAARPSMGKSLFARQLAYNAAGAGHPVGIIALEESRHKIVRNLLSLMTSLDNKRIRLGRERGGFQPDEWARVIEAANRLRKMPIYINDKARQAEAIHNQCCVWCARHQIRLVVVDHIGLVHVKSSGAYDMASEQMGKMVSMTKELGIAGVLCCQLNRKGHQQEGGDQRPQLNQLRNSGRIEEDADVVLSLHREDYYHIDDAGYNPNHEMEVSVLKWRDSIRGEVVRLETDLRYQRLADKSSIPEGI